jgi:hypothetical protein
MIPYKNTVLKTAEIKNIIESVPTFKRQGRWIYPSDHCINHMNKGACYCSMTKNALFFQIARGTVIHHQLLDGRDFRTFRTHSVRFCTGYPLKNALTPSYFPTFAETPYDVSVSEHTPANGRKIMPQKSTANFIQSK